MNSAIGFTAFWRVTDKEKLQAEMSLNRALAFFPDVKQLTFIIGDTSITIWGRGNLQDCVYTLPDGSLLAFVGSLSSDINWLEVKEQIIRSHTLIHFCPPWDGRFILIHISPDGEVWTMWNDWLACIPTYYINNGNNRILSTLEPVVVSSGQLTSDDFYMPSFVHLLIHGNYLSDWTLFKHMKIVPPDVMVQWKDSSQFILQLNTIEPTEERWNIGWDLLKEELHALATETILKMLKSQPSWILPLSSGLDSRLIACIGAEAGVNMQAYAWGMSNSKDVIYSKQLAKTLGIPWKHVYQSEDYIEKYLPVWVSLFGSSMHFHGMYQVPFLDGLQKGQNQKIISGFLGDALSGALVRELDFENFLRVRIPYSIYRGDRFLEIPEIQNLMRVSIDEELNEIMEEIETFQNITPGNYHQKLMKLVLWARVQRFTSFQLSLAHYWREIESPYFNKKYARFYYSLPRPYVDNRFLLIEMMKYFYPKAMCVPGTYGCEPARLTGRFLAKRRLAQILPTNISKKVLPEFAATKNRMDLAALQFSEMKALWPIKESKDTLLQWFHSDRLSDLYNKALTGDIKSLRVLQCIQVIAYRATPFQ